MTFSLRRMTISVALFAMSFTFASHSLAGTVFGNLGVSGTGALSGLNDDYGPDDSGQLLIAQGFQIGQSATDLNLQSVTVGLFAASSGSVPLALKIYSDFEGAPDQVLYTSSTVNVGNTALYTFPFSAVTLATDTPYWIIPNGPASWYVSNPTVTPTEQNASDYAYYGTKTLTPGVEGDPNVWTDPSSPFFITQYAVSINAVPEPSTLMLSGIGIAAALGLMHRRRLS